MINSEILLLKAEETISDLKTENIELQKRVTELEVENAKLKLQKAPPKAGLPSVVHPKKR